MADGSRETERPQVAPASLPFLSEAEETFLRAKYAFDRELELELNRGAAAYEQAVLNMLILLNGGAAVAYLGLYGALAETAAAAAPPALVPTMGALLAWGTGLVASGYASVRGLWAQQRFAQARRLKRQAVERLFLHGPEARRAAERASLEKRGETTFTQAKRALAVSKYLAYVALFAFAVGLTFASVAVILPAT